MSHYSLPRIPTIDQVQVEARAASFTKRSIKTTAKRQALAFLLSMTDLTTLEGMDSPDKVERLCRKARNPLPRSGADAAPEEQGTAVPQVAAVCVYPPFVRLAKNALRGSSVRVAAVATAFPSGQSFLDVRLEEVRRTVAEGADEIDMVIQRGTLLAGRYAAVYDEITAFKEVCGDAHLKVILETGELGTYDVVRKASQIAMDAGADFIKTSTGKIPSAATLPVSLVMLEAIRDHYEATGQRVGMKAAGGIRTAKQGWQYLAMVKETLGDAWLTPELFRIGASSLVNDVLMQWRRQETGCYQSSIYFTED